MAKITSKIRRVQRAQKMGSLNDARKEAEGIDAARDYEKIREQVEQEFQLCLQFVRPKVDEALRRLKLYNNQAREKTKVGDPMLYTIHQITLAKLVGDRLETIFKGREEGDEDTANNLNAVYEYDREEMQKEEHDYQWNWDASFFGRGLSLFNDFDTVTKTPIPEVIDPTTFLRDPMAISVNGTRSGNGGLRFCGWEIYQTHSELEKNPSYFNLDRLVYGNDEITSLTGKSRRARQEAQGLPMLTNWENLTTNYKYGILRWMTHIDGEKYLVELANNRTLVIRLQKLPWDYFPIIDRSFSPISHDWDGVSIPDIVEDKQRFRAALLNVAGDIVKADLNGMWIYRGNGFRKNQDFNFKFGKWIEFNGKESLQDAAQPLQTKQVSQGVKFIFDYLDVSAQKATAVSEIDQGGAQKGADTLGENEMIASSGETRNSLTAKIFGWSEKKWVKQYYAIYKEFFSKGLGKKMARLEGAFGTKWKELSPKDMITINALGPDIEITSRTVSEAKKARQLQQVQLVTPLIIQDPQADQLYFKRKTLKLIWDKDEVERIFPLTIDELQAREENDSLSDNKHVPVKVEQNHKVHLREHASAKDTPQTKAHIKAHEFMEMQKRVLGPQIPGLFPQTPEDQMAASQQGKSISTPTPAQNQNTPVNSMTTPMK